MIVTSVKGGFLQGEGGGTVHARTVKKKRKEKKT